MSNVEVIELASRFAPIIVLFMCFVVLNKAATMAEELHKMGALNLQGLKLLKSLMMTEEQRVYGTNTEKEMLETAVKELFAKSGKPEE